jgi:hypothetical protein
VDTVLSWLIEQESERRMRAARAAYHEKNG